MNDNWNRSIDRTFPGPSPGILMVNKSGYIQIKGLYTPPKVYYWTKGRINTVWIELPSNSHPAKLINGAITPLWLHHPAFVILRDYSELTFEWTGTLRRFQPPLVYKRPPSCTRAGDGKLSSQYMVYTRYILFLTASAPYPLISFFLNIIPTIQSHPQERKNPTWFVSIPL